MALATPPQSSARTPDQRAYDLLRRRAEEDQTAAYAGAGVLPGMGEGQRRLTDIAVQNDIDRVQQWYDVDDPNTMRGFAKTHPRQAGEYNAALRNQEAIRGANRGVEDAALRTTGAGLTPGGAAGPAPQTEGPAGLPPPERGGMMGGMSAGGAGASSSTALPGRWTPSANPTPGNRFEGDKSFDQSDLDQAIAGERGMPMDQRLFGPTAGLGSDNVEPSVQIADIIAGRVKYGDLKRRRDAVNSILDREEWGARAPDEPLVRSAKAGVSDYDRLLSAAQGVEQAQTTEAFPLAARLEDEQKGRDSREKIAAIEASRPRYGAERREDPVAKQRVLNDILKLTQNEEGEPFPGMEAMREDVISQILAGINTAGQQGAAGGATPGFPGAPAPLNPQEVEAAVQEGAAKGYTRQEILALIGAQ